MHYGDPFVFYEYNQVNPPMISFILVPNIHGETGEENNMERLENSCADACFLWLGMHILHR